MDFQERIKKLRLDKGLTLEQVGKGVGVTTQAVQKWESGIATPRSNTLKKLAEFLDVEPMWLQFGGGTVFPPSGIVAIQEDVDTTYTHLEIQLYDYKLSAGTGNSAWIENKQEAPLVFREQWFKHRNLNPEDLRAMHIRGDSMQPELNDSDTVIIDITDLDIVDGQIYAFVYKDKMYIKRIKHTEDGIALISTNSEYEPMNVTEESANRFQLLGRMVWRGG